MRKAFVIKKGKKYVDVEKGGYTSILEKATIFSSKKLANDEVFEETEKVIPVTITVSKESN